MCLEPAVWPELRGEQPSWLTRPSVYRGDPKGRLSGHPNKTSRSTLTEKEMMKMEQDKKKYEPPKAMRLDDKESGKGFCDPSGSGDLYCLENGSNAEFRCATPGNSAYEECGPMGNAVG